MIFKFSKKFEKMYKKAPKKIQDSFLQRIKLYENNKFYPILNNHSLTGKLKKYRSLDITGDWRLIFREEDGEVVFLVMIGTHSQLYKQ